MALKHFIVICLACVLTGCADVSHPVGRQAHSFAIYSVALTPNMPWRAATLGDLESLPLSNQPVLTDADIVSYDFAKHEIHVKQVDAILSRLPKLTVWGAPFVVMADGQRIYLGAFMSPVSSQSTSVPTIVIWTPADANPLTIERAYPDEGFALKSDPRSDERIRAALIGLKKLK
jgi:hypothetical protein